MRDTPPADTPLAAVDDGLRRLFADRERPRLREGFEVRLDRAIAATEARRRRRRRLAAIMWAYWSSSAALSAAIVWRLRDLLAGPGLWLGLGGVTLLGLTATLYYLVVPLPLQRRRRRTRLSS